MKLSIPQVEIKDDEGFSPAKDIFERKSFGERLANLIESSNQNLVIGLDAPWGEGKTTFIKMWKGYVEYRRENATTNLHKMRCIYYDAFSNDYQKDTFLAIVSEIYTLIKDESNDDKRRFKEKLIKTAKTLVRGGLKIGIRGATAGLLDETIVDSFKADISSLIADQADSIIEEQLKKVIDDKNTIQEFKICLKEYAKKEGNGAPIIFIIDELDRCRPDFAIDIIEQIKHLFSVDGITFLIVTNRQQMEDSIKARYGADINATNYLHKFINIWLRLPRTIDYNVNNFGDKYFRHIIGLMYNENEKAVNSEAKKILSELIKYYNPSFREIEKIATYYALINNLVMNNLMTNYQSLYALMCYLKATNPMTLEDIINKRINFDGLLKKLNLTNIPKIAELSNLYYLTKVMEYDFAEKERKMEMITNKEVVNEHSNTEPLSIITSLYSWLNGISYPY